MNRAQFAHVLRAAAAISDETTFVVIGSQAVLAQFENIPPDMARSIEVDLYPKFRPELADVIEGAIGADSPFHETFGYHADAVGPETARLPAKWEVRSVQIAIGGVTVICPEIHDLAVAKLLAGRPKDLEWIKAGIAASLIEPERVLKLLDEATANDVEFELARADWPPGNRMMIDHQSLRRAYLLEIASRLAKPGGQLIVARALAVIAKWESADGVLPRYIAGWRRVLNEGPDAVEKLAVSQTDEALELQHCMPFAGILSNKERRALRSKA